MTLRIFFLYSFLFVSVCLSLIATFNYAGNKLYYLLFSLIFNGLVYLGLFRQKYYVESFLAIFLWLGFWIKLSYHLTVNEFIFQNPIGKFDFSPAAWDQTLIVSMCGALGFFAGTRIVRLLSKKTTLYFQKTNPLPPKNYENHRKIFISIFVFALILISALNLYYGVYQRGTVPQTKIPLVLYSALAWMLSSGFAICAATFVFWEALASRSVTLAIFMTMLEGFITNLSILSRGFILNPSPQIYSAAIQPPTAVKKISRKGKFFLIGAFVVFFVGSIFSTTLVRFNHFSKGDFNDQVALHKNIKTSVGTLFIDRWVGSEGVMSEVLYPHLGWDLWNKAMDESYSDSGTSFYDKEIANSYYTTFYTPENIEKHHFISMPGIIAFLYYPGSLFFLFLVCTLLGCIFVMLEIFVYRVTVNPILCALFAESFSFKIMHFGYAPKRSFIYYFSFILMVLIIAAIQKFYFKKKHEDSNQQFRGS